MVLKKVKKMAKNDPKSHVLGRTCDPKVTKNVLFDQVIDDLIVRLKFDMLGKPVCIVFRIVDFIV